MNDRITIYKVDNDKYQFLLIPSDKVTGIEDKILQKESVPKYLYDAWLAKTFMPERPGKPIKEKYIALALNPTNARSQEQLQLLPPPRLYGRPEAQEFI